MSFFLTPSQSGGRSFRRSRDMVVVRDHRHELRRLGLDTLDGVMNSKATRLVNHSGHREILLVSLDERIRLFVKRIWKEHAKDRFIALLRHGQLRSAARREWENLMAMERARIRVGRPVAFGERFALLSGGFSYLITEAAGGISLDDFIAGSAAEDERRTILRQLARWIRQMHDAGIAYPDLFARHVFVDQTVADARFALIDVARIDQRRIIGPAMRARDLAALNASTPLRRLAIAERLRFLREYTGGDCRDLLRRIERRTKRLLRRTKFSGFAGADHMDRRAVEGEKRGRDSF